MKTWKQILVISVCVLGGAFLIGGFFVGIVYHISHRLDCERFNIDNIELRTETNIPELAEGAVCHYDQRLKVKSNFFRLDTSVEMKRYINRNHFKKVTDSIPAFTYQKAWNTALSTKAIPGSLYAKKDFAIGEESGNMDSWLYILDSTSGEMWMEIIRTKHH